MSKLTIAQRRAIIAAPQAHRICQRLAKEYGVSRNYVAALRCGSAVSFQVTCGRPGRQVRPHSHVKTTKRLGEGRSPYCPDCLEHYEFQFNALIGQTIEVCRCRSQMITPEVQRLQWVPPKGHTDGFERRAS